MNCRGSILIFVVWILILLTLLATSVSLRSRLGIKLSTFFTHHSENAYRMHSAVNLAAYFINEDEDPDNDSTFDSWYNTPKGFDGFELSKEVAISITDEESKINLNRVDKNQSAAPILTAFFDILKENNVQLKTSPSDIINSIMAWRGDNTAYEKGRPITESEYKKCVNVNFNCFETAEELKLIKYMTPEDFETLKPFFTVYEPSTPLFQGQPTYFQPGGFFQIGANQQSTFRVNINTVHEWILKALIQSSRIGSNSEKELLCQAVIKARKGDAKNAPVTFDMTDIAPPGKGLIRKLWPKETQDLESRGGTTDSFPAPGIVGLVNYLVSQFFTVNSQFFSVHVETKGEGSLPLAKAEAVLGPRQQILVKTAQRNYNSQWLWTDALRGYPYQILQWSERVKR